jgi:hypothetical protein
MDPRIQIRIRIHTKMSWIPEHWLKLSSKSEDLLQEKSGDSENKVQSIEGICRLICMAKSSQPLKVYIGRCPGLIIFSKLHR